MNTHTHTVIGSHVRVNALQPVVDMCWQHPSVDKHTTAHLWHIHAGGGRGGTYGWLIEATAI